MQNAIPRRLGASNGQMKSLSEAAAMLSHQMAHRAAGGSVLGDITNVSSNHQGGFAAQAYKAPTRGSQCFNEPSVVGTVEGAQADAMACNDNPMDTQLVVEYEPDIFRRLHLNEHAYMPSPDYMVLQPEINARMRAILVDWLVEVQMKYKLQPATLFLAVSILDRYLSRRHVPRKRLQLVGVTGMLLASKFEEIYPPETREFVYIMDNSHSKEEILAEESVVLTTVGFNLCCPTTFHFAERLRRASGCSEAHGHLVQYIVEMTLMDYKLLRYPPSHLAAASMYLSNKLLKESPSWPPVLERLSGLNASVLKLIAEEICNVFEAKQEHSKALRRKYSQACFSCVAKEDFWK